MSIEVANLRFVGFLLLGLGVSHAYFPRRFGWPAETQTLTLLTRQVFFVHNAFIGFMVFLQGLLCLVLPNELVRRSPLAGAVLAGFAVFWMARLVVQFFVYESELWRGKRFETAIHLLFGCLWAYFALTFGIGAWRQLIG